MQYPASGDRAIHSDASRGCPLLVVTDFGLGWLAVLSGREAVDAC
jgi:hypothetical protein